MRTATRADIPALERICHDTQLKAGRGFTPLALGRVYGFAEWWDSDATIICTDTADGFIVTVAEPEVWRVVMLQPDTMTPFAARGLLGAALEADIKRGRVKAGVECRGRMLKADPVEMKTAAAMTAMFAPEILTRDLGKSVEVFMPAETLAQKLRVRI